jgi:hypothetical protein
MIKPIKNKKIWTKYRKGILIFFLFLIKFAYFKLLFFFSLLFLKTNQNNQSEKNYLILKRFS